VNSSRWADDGGVDGIFLRCPLPAPRLGHRAGGRRGGITGGVDAVHEVRAPLGSPIGVEQCSRCAFVSTHMEVLIAKRPMSECCPIVAPRHPHHTMASPNGVAVAGKGVLAAPVDDCRAPGSGHVSRVLCVDPGAIPVAARLANVRHAEALAAAPEAQQAMREEVRGACARHAFYGAGGGRAGGCPFPLKLVLALSSLCWVTGAHVRDLDRGHTI
jgi:hypothetical protein